MQTVSEFAIVYLKTGACFGFGFGALAQCFKLSQEWRLKHSLVLTFGWPVFTVMLIWSYFNDE